jgi:hypothetical protein
MSEKMYHEPLKFNSPVLFVFAARAEASVKVFDTMMYEVTSPPSERPDYLQGPAILFPPENRECEIEPEWFANKSPLGISARYTAKPWSTVVKRTSKGDLEYYLRDQYGVSEKVVYGHSHHAVYFDSWWRYHEVCEELLRDVNNLEQDLYVFYEKIRLGADVKAEDEASRFRRAVTNAFISWVKGSNKPLETRYFWVKTRYQQACSAFDAKLNNIFCRTPF